MTDVGNSEFDARLTPTGKASVASVIGGLALACNVSYAQSQPPRVTGRLIGKPEIVFDTRTQSCEAIDIPDTTARAFRDNHGLVHLFASHYVTRAMVGTTLDNVIHRCEIVYKSQLNPDPASYSDFDWLGSFYTIDGVHVVALVHNEYHGWAHSGMCLHKAPPQVAGHCWWNTVGFMTSDNGGYSFTQPTAPGNLVASPATKYDPANISGATGYYAPTNIVYRDGYYYSLIGAWSAPHQTSGACLIRSENLANPASWRAWSGNAFDVTFDDPYRPRRVTQSSAGCAPVYPGFAQSLVQFATTGQFLLTEYTRDTRYGPPGLYLASSADLIHWVRPALVITTEDLSKVFPGGHWKFDYFSLIDADSKDRNFQTVSSQPYVYFTRYDLSKPPLQRSLIRVRLSLAPVDAQSATRTKN
jgi:hypothetical protein